MSAVPARTNNDRLVVALGVVAVVLSISTATAEALHLLPSGLGVALVLAFASVAIRVMFRLRATKSSALSNPKVMNVVSLILLGVSFVTAVVDVVTPIVHHSLVPLSQYIGYFFTDLLSFGYGGMLLLVIAVPARTMGWRSILGVLLCGFLAVSSLALVIDTPLVTALGSYNQFVVAFVVPVTEEVLKAAPVAIFALLAARNLKARPSAVDFGLLGYASGMGFALIEDADYGRAFGSWDSAPPLSHIFPTTEVVVGFVSQGEIGVGHAVETAFVGLAIGFGVLYRRRWRFAWIAIPGALALAVIEHCLQNAELPPVVLQVLVANGSLIGYLLPLAMIAFAIFEHRPLTHIRDLRGGLLIDPASLAAQRARLAELQRRRVRPVSALVTPAASTTGVER